MPSVDARDLDRLIERWTQLLEDCPDMKRGLLEKLSQELLRDVRAEIGGSGTVQGWQERYLGSKNGYVAVRPKAETYQVTGSGKRYAVGYVTNAIEGGHKHRRPRPTNTKGYHYTRGRIYTAAVPGRHFYAKVRMALSGYGQEQLLALAREIAGRWEGSRT